MSIRDDAMNDILTATSPDVIGQNVNVDGNDLGAVVKSFTAQEVAALGFDGFSMQMVRLTLTVTDLVVVPVYGQAVEVDGVVWETHLAARNGNRLRLTLKRYVS